MDDGVQIKICVYVVSEVPNDNDEDGPTMETVGVESMSLSE
jgi:hypothetical protein